MISRLSTPLVLLLATATVHAWQADRPLPDQRGTDDFSIQDLAPARDENAIRLRVRFGDVERSVRLARWSVRGPNFRVLVDDGVTLREAAPPPESAVRGVVLDPAGGEAVGSFTDAGFSGVVEFGERWTVVPLSQYRAGAAPGLHVVFRGGAAGDWACGNDDLPRPPDAPQDDAGGFTGRSSYTVRLCEVACDADTEFYTANGSSVAATVADIEGVLNGASRIYEQDTQVAMQVGTVIVRTVEPDPYTSTTPATILTEFGTQWVNNHADIHRDAAQLFTGKDLAGVTVGVSRVAGVCITSSVTLGGYSVVQSRFSAEFDRRVALTAHELGHTFGISGHCDGDWDCRVMCSSMGSCSGYRSFDAISVVGIRAYVATLQCLSTGSVELMTTSFPFFDSFPPGALNSSRWTAIDGASVSQVSQNPPSPSGAAWIVAHNTMRTRPMAVTAPPRLTFWSEYRGTESGDKLHLEYFRTSTGTWVTLADVRSDGANQTQFVQRVYDLPADAPGSHFSLRITGWAVDSDNTDNWYIDNLSIDSVPCPADFNGDGFLDFFDFSDFIDCFEGAACPPGKTADFNADGFVDFFDFDAFVAAFEIGC